MADLFGYIPVFPVEPDIFESLALKYLSVEIKH